MVNIAMIEMEYNVAFFIPWALVLLLFKKKETVTGNMAYRHGCSTEINPHRKPSRKVFSNDLGKTLTGLDVSACEKTLNTKKQNKQVRIIFDFFIQKQDKKNDRPGYTSTSKYFKAYNN